MSLEAEYIPLDAMRLRANSQKELRSRLADGPIPIDEWFARLTKLYYEHHVIGDDFPTPPELFPQMGSSVALFALHTYEGMGSPKTFDVYEAGGGNGTLMKSFLHQAARYPDFFKSIRYHEIEQSEHLIERQFGLLQGSPELLEKVTWQNADICSLNFNKVPAGMYIASENDDDLPSKAVFKRNGAPTELYIVLEDGSVTQKELAPSSELIECIQKYPEWWNMVPENLQIPLPLHIQSVLLRERLIASFDKLVMFTSDYGYELNKVAQYMPNWIFPQCKTFVQNHKKTFSDGNEYSSMYKYAGIGNHTSNIDFTLISYPGVEMGMITTTINSRDFLSRHGIMQFAEDHVSELVTSGKIAEAILYLRRLSGVIDVSNDWTTQVQLKGISEPIPVGEKSDHTVSALYDLAQRYRLGDIRNLA